MCWNKGRLFWKIAKLFYFYHLKKLVRPEILDPTSYIINDKIVEQKLLNTKLQRLSEKLIIRRTQQDIFINVRRSSRKSAGNEAWIFSRYFWKIVKYQI
jgi:hypothetical protein